MIRALFLLSPIFVSLFWSVSLLERADKFGKPRRFLSIFMLFNLFIFTSHYFYFASYPDIYVYFDMVLTVTGLSVFPLYHIYFRLLTVDEKFSFKVHSKYLLVPAIISMIYLTVIILVPKNEYKAWLFYEIDPWGTVYVSILSIMRIIIKTTFIVLLIISLVLNHSLIKKYGYKAGEYYSDIGDARSRNLKLLDYSLIAVCLVSAAAQALGRSRISTNELSIILIWTSLSVSIYIMGLVGFRQKPLNPFYEKEETELRPEHDPGIPSFLKDKDFIINRIMEEFKNNKLYLNSELSIIDVAETIGTNRTYISAVINHYFSQNFCTFVNSFRIAELERLLTENPELSTEKAAEICGFGSVNSMKRAVVVKTGLSFFELRRKIISSVPKEA